jgi:CRISPR-associated protein Cas1
MARRSKTDAKSKGPWAERRPVPCCQLGVLHAFGPGVLHATNHQLQFNGSGDRRLRVPLRELQLVCLYGPVRVTAGAVRLVTDAGAGLAYFSANGLRTNGVLQPATDAWKGRRYRQFQAVHDRPWMLGQARLLVVQKLQSFEDALAYARRQGRLDDRALALLHDLPGLRQRAELAPDHASLRGHEGTAARRWFEAFDGLLPTGWTLPGRRKRPPTDPVNALLSLGYTLLFHRVQAACAAWGLDTALGFFHEYRPGRASLACDLMEPFRVPAIDRLLLQTIAMRRYDARDFVTDAGDFSVRLQEDAFKRWLGDLEAHLHAGTESRPSLQVQIVERVRRLTESLPAWDGRWPNASQGNDLLPDSGLASLDGTEAEALD